MGIFEAARLGTRWRWTNLDMVLWYMRISESLMSSVNTLLVIMIMDKC